MKIIEGIQQGSDAWHSHRATARNASEAPAMMGFSAFMSRNELIRQKATGATADIDPDTQRRFDRGHEIEEFARGLAEQFLVEDLYPITATDDDGYLSASFDGMAMDADTIWECKTANAALRTALDAGDLPDAYWPQVEQQLLISGARRAVFTISDGTESGTRHMEYLPHPDRQERLVAAWQQFDQDVANYQHVEVIPAAVATPTMALPALSIQVDGSIALRDNLTVFGDALTAYVERINKKPETDQDFADLEAAVKTLKAAEEALSAAESGALAQTASIDTMRRTVELYRALARDNRLLITKLVTSEKENRRAEILRKGQEALATHIEALNTRLGKSYMPIIHPEFQARMKGLKTIESLNNAVDTELARCKIEANAIADRIDANLKSLRELAADYASLFPDTAQIVQKANDDLVALIKTRITEHKAAEAKKEADRTATPPAVLASAPSKEGAGLAVAAAHLERIADTGRQMNLSEICARLDFTVTALLLDRLGFAAKIDRNSKLYRESDFPLICQALINHIAAVANEKKAA